MLYKNSFSINSIMIIVHMWFLMNCCAVAPVTFMFIECGHLTSHKSLAFVISSGDMISSVSTSHCPISMALFLVYVPYFPVLTSHGNFACCTISHGILHHCYFYYIHAALHNVKIVFVSSHRIFWCIHVSIFKISTSHINRSFVDIVQLIVVFSMSAIIVFTDGFS